jgi:SapC
MTRHVLLNNVTHKDLKIKTHYSADYGDNVQAVLTFPTEFGDVQREYPIFFRKDPASGEHQALALLGFEKGENLFLDDRDWNASYVPGVVARGPFLIGFQEQEINGELSKEPVIHVDMDSSRVGDGEGESVFLPHGGNTPYLERIATILKGLHDGMALSKTMFATFESLGLIEPVAIKVQISKDLTYELTGYSTISEEKLAQLDGETLEKLNRMGFLQGAFLVIASLGNVKKLIELKRRRLIAASQKL